MTYRARIEGGRDANYRRGLACSTTIGGDVGYDDSYGYGNGDTDSHGAGPQLNIQPETMSAPPDEENFTWQDSPANNSGQSSAAPIAVTMLYFKDGSSYGVTDYWLAEGNLHYVTTYGGKNSVRADQLDLQRTVDENAQNGVDFVLRPAAPSPQQ